MKRLIRFLIAAFIVTTLAVCAASCGVGSQDNSISSDGTFVYEKNESKDGYLIGAESDFAETEITIPSTYNNLPVVGIKNGGFCERESLIKVIIPDSVTSIGNSSFQSCDNLVSVTVGANVEIIDGGAFVGCLRLVEIINKSPLDICAESEDYGAIGQYAKIIHNEESKIVDNDGYLFVSSNDVNYLVSYTGQEKELTLPSEDDIGEYVINDYAFFESDVTSVVIPDCVTRIGTQAFFNCGRLSSAVIGDGVTYIGCRAFECCDHLVSATLGSKLDTIDESAFSQCDRLVEIINKSALVIGIGEIDNGCVGSRAKIIHKKESKIFNENGYVFLNADKKYLVDYIGEDTAITLPDNYMPGSTSVKDIYVINQFAFSGSRITDVTVPDSVYGIEFYAFGDCWHLQSVTIAANISNIEPQVFFECNRLKNVKLPESVTSIGMQAFYGCCELTEINIGKNVSYIDNTTFDDCSSLTNIIVSEDNNTYKSIDGNLYSKDGKTLVIYAEGKKEKTFTVPEEVIHIGDGAFSFCFNLTNIIIHDYVKSIGNGAFWQCDDNLVYNRYDNAYYLGNETNKYLYLVKGVSEDITSCKISGECKIICDGAFYGCNDLTTVTIIGEGISIGTTAFGACENLRFNKYKNGYYLGDSLTPFAYLIYMEDLGDYEATYEIHKDCEAICYGAFLNVWMESLTIPHGVKYICNGAFYRCGISKSISVPRTVRVIGVSAFSESNAHCITYEGTQKEWDNIEIYDESESFKKLLILYKNNV